MRKSELAKPVPEQLNFSANKTSTSDQIFGIKADAAKEDNLFHEGLYSGEEDNPA